MVRLIFLVIFVFLYSLSYQFFIEHTINKETITEEIKKEKTINAVQQHAREGTKKPNALCRDINESRFLTIKACRMPNPTYILETFHPFNFISPSSSSGTLHAGVGH